MRTHEFKREMRFCIDNIDPASIEDAGKTLASADTVYIVGNGGSAANAEHAANDFIKVSGLITVPMTQVSVLSAYANDRSYEECFSAPLSKMITSRDVLVCLSVSGTSPNVIRAMEVAREQFAPIILLTGTVKNHSTSTIGWLDRGGQIVSVTSEDFGVVETVHQAILHMIANKVKEIKDVDHGS